jgi:outer membrane protein assembly factor BamB
VFERVVAARDLRAAAAIDPDADFRDTLAVSDRPQRRRSRSVGAGFGSLWARSGSSLLQISRTGEVVAQIADVFPAKPAVAGAQPLAVGSGSVWTLSTRTLIRIDPSTGQILARIATPQGCEQIVGVAGAVFVACRDSSLVKIDAATGKARVLVTTGVSPSGLGYGHGSVWWINFSEAGGVTRIDPNTGGVTVISSPYAGFVASTPKEMWFVDVSGGAFSISPDGGSASGSAPKAPVALGVTTDGTTVWINDGDLVGFDAETGKVTQRVDVSGRQKAQSVAGVAILGQSIWLVDPKGQRIVEATI